MTPSPRIDRSRRTTDGMCEYYAILSGRHYSVRGRRVNLTLEGRRIIRRVRDRVRTALLTQYRMPD